MRAVCSEHTAGAGLLECNLSRTCRLGRGRGRPLGLLTWFLESAHNSHDKDCCKNMYIYICIYIYIYIYIYVC